MTVMDINILIKLARLMRISMRELLGRVKIEGYLSDPLDYDTGLRQDDGFCPA